MTGAASPVERRAMLATVAVAVLLGLFAMNDVPAGVFQDDGHYAILARALAHGDGYRYMNLPGAPGATHFPPGYPLLLAPLWWIAPQFPANLAILKLLNVALLPLAALGVHAVARRLGGLSAIAASAVAVASVATVPLLYLNGLLFSETAFIAALCAVLLGAEQLAARRDATSWRAALAVGLAIGALAMLRTIGVTLLPALLAVLAWRRRWRDAALVCVGALVFLLPWQLWTAAHGRDVPDAVAGGYGAYGPWIADAWRSGGLPFAQAVFLENVRGLLMPLTLFGLIQAPGEVQALAIIGLVVLAGAGAWRMWPRAPVTLATFVPYGALLLAWPFPPDRFLWPLWPIVLIALVVGAMTLGAAAQPRRVHLAARAAAIALAALYAVWHVRTWPGRSWEAGERRNAQLGLAAAAVARSLPADGLVASDQDAMVNLYAGRPAVPLVALTAVQHVRMRSVVEVAAQVSAVLDAYHPRWVVVVQLESWRAAQLLAQRGRLKLSGADPSGVLVYDVVR